MNSGNKQGAAERSFRLSWQVGALCLSLGLLIKLFVNPASQAALNAAHFTSGLFVGFAAVCLLAPPACRMWAVRRDRNTL